MASRNQIREQIYAMVRMQCCSVNGLAQENITYLTDSGFKLNKPAQHHPVPEQCKLMQIETLQGGRAKISFDAIEHKDCYEIKITGSAGFVQTTVTTKSPIILENLQTNAVLTAVVRGINGKGAGMWSEPRLFALAPDATVFDNVHRLPASTATDLSNANDMANPLKNASGGQRKVYHVLTTKPQSPSHCPWSHR